MVLSGFHSKDILSDARFSGAAASNGMCIRIKMELSEDTHIICFGRRMERPSAVILHELLGTSGYVFPTCDLAVTVGVSRVILCDTM